jgi:hypothetical protein
MTRVLTLDGQLKDHQRFIGMLLNGFCLGGDKIAEGNQGRRTRDERRTAGTVLRAIKTLVKDPESKVIELKEEGGTLELTQAGHDLLVRYLDAYPWITYEAQMATDLLDWVMAATEKRDSA